MIELSDTHRRARLRSRESVARWRIESASWVGWLYGVNGAVGAIWGLFRGVAQRSPAVLVGAALTVAICAGMAWGIHRMRQGSRRAAVAVVGCATLFSVIGILSRGFGVIDLVALGALINGAYGVFELARVRRDSSLVPPAPPRRSLARVGLWGHGD
jgi:hypothetical protein